MPLAGLKVVKKDSDVDGTHLVLDTGKALAKVPVLVALADQTPIVSPAFVDALTAAAELLAAPAEAREKRERWSALEEDVVKDWPQEAAFEPEIDVAGSRGSFARDPARQSLLKGLTVLGLRIKVRRSLSAARCCLLLAAALALCLPVVVLDLTHRVRTLLPTRRTARPSRLRRESSSDAEGRSSRST